MKKYPTTYKCSCGNLSLSKQQCSDCRDNEMQKEMKMMPNGNYEEIISPVQHRCYFDSQWECVEYGYQSGKLKLCHENGDPYEDGYGVEIEVKFCPFCGYQPERRQTALHK